MTDQTELLGPVAQPCAPGPRHFAERILNGEPRDQVLAEVNPDWLTLVLKHVENNREKQKHRPNPSGRTGVCKGCRAPIIWTVTKNGKKMPRDPDGTPHWETCPQAGRFRR